MVSVAVIEDNQNLRETRVEVLEDAGYEAVGLKGPYPRIDELIDEIKSGYNSALSDFQLMSRGWASFEGAQLVSELVSAQIPSLLVTRFSTAMMPEIQRFRRHIPILLEPSEANDAQILERSFQFVKDEIEGNISTTRKPWRTLIRLEEVAAGGPDPHALAVIPGWDHQEGIKLPLDRFPREWSPMLQTGFRFFATVNLGATNPKELYIEDFERGEE